MDRYKFRGKRLDNGEWVYGSLVIDKDLNTCDIVGYEYYTDSDGYQREPFSHEVDPSTVGQYTGLPDKNGKEIYEGDIVAGMSFMKAMVNSWGGENNTYGDDVQEVRYERGSYRLFKDDKWTAVIDHHTSSFVKDLEVIGNIHDNPSLLKGE